MIIIGNYTIAIFFFLMAMICWGSWANTQKIAAKNWRFELYYWDLTIGLLLFAALCTFTLGSIGAEGRPFLADIRQADTSSIVYAMLGGVVWNLGTLLIVAAIAVAGLSVAFPIGGGIAWVLGILVNYMLVIFDRGKPEGEPLLMFCGIAFIIIAIFLSMFSYRRLAKQTKKPSTRGIILSIAAGLLIAFFYGLVVKSIDNSFVKGGTGTLTPYSAVFFFSIGIFVSTFFFNPIFMRYPVEGVRVKMSEYWKGSLKTHFSGILGGFIWMLGMVMSFMAIGAADPAISYALSNAAPVVAILWGIFVWKEFKEAPEGTNRLLLFMFISYLIGLAMITLSH